MSEGATNHSLETRGRAIGIVLAGLTTRKVSENLGVSQSAVVKWMKKNRV